MPVYISECSPPAIRGRLIGIFEILLQFSQIIGFWVNYGVNKNISAASDTQWRIPFALQFVPGTLLVIAMFFQPESPRWLAKKSRWEQAQKVLSRLRNLPEDHGYIVWEVETVRAQLEHEAESPNRSFIVKVKEVLTSNVRSRLLIGMALMILQNLSGINVSDND